MSRFESVKMREEWFAFGVDGFHTYEHVYDTVGSLPFSICRVGETQIAVISQRAVTEDERMRLLATPRLAPFDRIDGLCTASLVTPADAPQLEAGRGPPAVIDCVVLAPDDADHETIAVAVACALYSEGTFDYEPAQYVVRLGGELLRVTLEFDIDSESWSADVISDRENS